MDDPEDSMMHLSTTPASAAAAHNRRRRPRPGSPAPEFEEGGGDDGGLLAMKRQMLLDSRAAAPQHPMAAGGFFGAAPAGTASLPAAAAHPFGRPSSPYCAAADLAAAASALSMSGGSSPEDEPGRVLVPGVVGAGDWGGSPNLVVRCEWVPGPGFGQVHVVAPHLPTLALPPGRGASEVVALEEAARVVHSFLRLWGPRDWDDLLTCMDVVVRFERPPAHVEEPQQQPRRKFTRKVYLMTSVDAPLLAGMGPGILLALLQLLTRFQPWGPQMRLRPRVAVLGELTLEGRLVAASRPSPTVRPLSLLVPRVHAALASGVVDCVVLPREVQEEVDQAGLTAAVDPGALRFVDDVRGLLALALDGDEAVYAWAPAPQGQGGGSSGGGGSGSSQARRLFVAPTLLPEGSVSVAPRCVEACALPRSRSNQAGRFIITGLSHVPSSGGKGLGMGMGMGGSSSDGGSSSSSARAALNTARFLLLKHQADIARLLGPPAVDLRAMRLLVADDPAGGSAAAAAAGGGGMNMCLKGVPIDVHLHLPQALPSPAYGLPALLALVAVAWPHARDSLEGIASLGEVNAVGALGLHERLRPTFVAALTACGARKVVLPGAQARELVRKEGGGVGDRWLLQSGAMVQGADRVLDVVRACFLGDDGL